MPTLTPKQEKIIVAMVGKIDDLVTERSGHDLPEVSLNALHDLLVKPGFHAGRSAAGCHFVHQVEEPEPGDHFPAQRRDFGRGEIGQCSIAECGEIRRRVAVGGREIDRGAHLFQAS